VGLLGRPRRARALERYGRLFALAFAAYGVACDDPPPDAAAGRLLTLPGDSGGAKLELADASAVAPVQPDGGATPAPVVEDGGADLSNTDDGPDEP
jgi:hypothetical protein